MRDRPPPEGSAPARPGRPRSEASRQAILTAAVELVAEQGYAALSIEGIAARSGTGKQTIYRWWPTKADVVLEALATKADLHVPIPDTGSYRDDLRAFLATTLAMGAQPRVPEVLRSLMAHAQLDPGFAVRFRSRFLQRRRDALAVVVDRAAGRGEVPPGLSRETTLDLVFGVIWYRILTTPDTTALVGPGRAQELIDELLIAVTGGRA